jgi:NRAMP (natural resistance-associated macrophage protein)-like metal ion transporter
VPLLAVLGPGLLAGLSDDDPAGITTYSVLGARHGYRLLWVLAAATLALIVFHELGARLGVISGKGLAQLVRERFGRRVAAAVGSALVLANVGTMCAELAGIAVGARLLGGVPPEVSVPIACLAVSALVLRGSFHRVEHVLLALAAVFAAYLLSGVLSHPDWGAAAHGLVVPSLPLTRDAVYLAVATVGTTLAPWGLAFIQSYAADKHIPADELGYERVDVVVGAVLTGVIGACVVVACAATLHARGAEIDDAADAARGLAPLAGSLASTLFGLGLVGAALLAAAVVPLSTAYSTCEALGLPTGVDDRVGQAPAFYGVFGGVVVVAAAVVLVPGAPLLGILVGSQALNAVLLLAILPFLVALGRDRELLGSHALGRPGLVLAGAALALVVASIAALGVLAVV